MIALLKSKFGTIVLCLALGGAGFLAARAIIQKYTVDRQIAQMQARAASISNDNQQLSDLVKYLNTDQYRQKAAREQLNLKKDGEYVVALPPDTQESASGATTTTGGTLGNPQKWYRYFFSN